MLIHIHFIYIYIIYMDQQYTYSQYALNVGGRNLLYVHVNHKNRIKKFHVQSLARTRLPFSPKYEYMIRQHTQHTITILFYGQITSKTYE
jgi:hypothetical protein